MKQFAPAKINLYLHILGRRPDGFHELETLMAPISLGDTLQIDLIASGIEFTCSDPALSDAKDNLATKAARVFLEDFRLATGVRIHLEKAVPVGGRTWRRQQRCCGGASGFASINQSRMHRCQAGRVGCAIGK